MGKKCTSCVFAYPALKHPSHLSIYPKWDAWDGWDNEQPFICSQHPKRCFAGNRQATICIWSHRNRTSPWVSPGCLAFGQTYHYLTAARHGQSKMEYEQRDLFTHLPCGRGAACTEVRQQAFPDEMTDSVWLQSVFNCTNIVATLGSNF